MRWPRELRQKVGLFAAAALFSACGTLERVAVEPSVPPEPEAVPASTVPAPSEPLPAPAEAPAPAPVRPDPVAASPPPPPPPPSRILVLSSSDAASYSEVAAALAERLDPRYELEPLTLGDAGSAAPIADREPGHWAAVVAIGEAAAAAVDTELDVPTVFCQIFDYARLLGRETLFGVEALPPLALQLRHFKQVAARAESLAMLLPAGETALAEAARRAAADNGLALEVEFATSDREVLYRFRRLASSVDGFWLLPSSEILSPRVLREVLDHAGSRGLPSLVFDEALLDFGGLMSVGGNHDDIAATVARVVDALVDGRADELERVTPLTTADVKLNLDAAAALGITATRPGVGARGFSFGR